MSIGTRIFEIRKSHNLTQERFAAILGVDPAYISKIEKDKSSPSESLLNHICCRFFISKKWLDSGEGSMLAPPEEALTRQIAHYGQQATIEAFLNVMEECSLGLSLLQQLHRPNIKDAELNRLINTLYDIWAAGDENLKGWAVIQFDRAFPADVVQEAQKKRTENYKRLSAGEVS